MSTRIESPDPSGEDGTVCCLDCGWSGDQGDLVMTKAAQLQCPACHDGH